MARIWFVREKPDKITAWRQDDSSWSLSRWLWWCSPRPWGHHLPPWSLEAVLEAFFDRDLACTLACLFFSSDLANFLPQESHVNGFSPAKSGDKWKLSYIGILLVRLWTEWFVLFVKIQIISILVLKSYSETFGGEVSRPSIEKGS